MLKSDNNVFECAYTLIWYWKRHIYPARYEVLESLSIPYSLHLIYNDIFSKSTVLVLWAQRFSIQSSACESLAGWDGPAHFCLDNQLSIQQIQ